MHDHDREDSTPSGRLPLPETGTPLEWVREIVAEQEAWDAGEAAPDDAAEDGVAWVLEIIDRHPEVVPDLVDELVGAVAGGRGRAGGTLSTALIWAAGDRPEVVGHVERLRGHEAAEVRAEADFALDAIRRRAEGPGIR